MACGGGPALAVVSGGRCDFAAPAGVTGSGGSACAAVDAGMLGGPSLGGVASGGGPALGAVGPKSADGMLAETRALGRGRSGRRRGQTTASPQPRAASDHGEDVHAEAVVDVKSAVDAQAFWRSTFAELNRAMDVAGSIVGAASVRQAIRDSKRSLLQARESYDENIIGLARFAELVLSQKMRVRSWWRQGGAF